MKGLDLMGKNFLMDEIKKIDKKGLFTADTVPTFGFPTGLTLYDALNGFLVTVPNKDFTEIVDSWYNMGVMGGQFVMEIGNSGTGKTALAIQAGSNMVAPYEYGMFLHADAEHTSEKRHIMKLNHWRPDMMEDRYNDLNKKEYLFYNYFYYSDYINEAYLLDKIKSKKDKYPVLLKVFENNNNNANKFSLDNLPNFNEVLNLFNEKYFYSIKRDKQ